MSKDKAEKIYFEYTNDINNWTEKDFEEAISVLLA